MGAKIEFVVTARPSWSRVKNLIREYATLDGLNSLSITLIGSAISEKYGDIREQMPLGIQIKSYSTYDGNLSLSSIANTSIKGAQALSYKWELERPKSVLVIADRTETLGVSLAAATMQIPLIHLQGGETSGSIDNKIRGANSKLADLHLTTNQFTAQNLMMQGESSSTIKIIGCPSVDIVSERMKNSNQILEFSEMYGGVGANFSTELEFGIIFFHPDTLMLSDNIEWVNKLISLTGKSNLNWFWFWPNVDFGGEAISKIIRKHRELKTLGNIRFLKNITPESFIDLAIKSSIIVGNSSFGIREASFIGVPVINIGKRQNGRQRGENVIDVISPTELDVYVDSLHGKRFKQSNLYGDGNASKLGALELKNWEPSLKKYL